MQTKLAFLSLNLAKMISDELNDAGVILTDYTVDGQRLTAEQRITCINNARSFVFYKYLSTLKNNVLFSAMFPEYTGIETLDITDLPLYVKLVMNFTAGGNVYYPIASNLYAESKNNPFSVYYHTKGYFFVQSGQELKPTRDLTPGQTISNNYECTFIREPIPVLIDIDGEDIPDRQGLQTEILQQAFKEATVYLNYQ